MKLLRKFALAWMFAWLPISGVMATTMPFCAQGIMGMAAESAPAMADDAENPPCHGQGKSQDDATVSIEHCDLCHIAGAVAPPCLPVIANVPPSLPPSVDRVEVFSSFIPDTPQHPPLSTPA